MISLYSFPSWAQNNENLNVLFIVSDDLTASAMSSYGHETVSTPNLDKLASEGVRFSRMYSQYPICGPSRASFMSGLYPETNGVIKNDDQPGSYRRITKALSDHPSMAGFFRERNYFTARVSKIFHMGVPGGIERGDPGGDDPDSWDYAYNVLGPETLSPGSLEWLSPKNPHYGGNFSRMIIPDSLQGGQTDYLATNQAIAILENRAGKVPDHGTNKQRIKQDAPFFLAVGFVRPHVPLVAPENCFAPYPEYEMELPSVVIGENVPEPALRRTNEKVFGMDKSQQKKILSGYMASVQFMDQQVGRLLDALDRLDLRKNTIVVFISDHGYNLGEHHCWSKISLWEESIRVPAIISVPGKKYEEHYGSMADQVVELIDLYPTMTDLLGYKAETPVILQGESLVATLDGSYEKSFTADYAYTISYQGEAASLRTDQWRYTRWGENVEASNEELYDHVTDPEEHRNLVGDPAVQMVLTQLRNKMNNVRKRSRSILGQPSRDD
ncbi:sulfatase [Membranicola marinus]|uniref:Sulfatase n=1 Tax=Membranihabitans marinus TaxID=1227546 RepID=A0A953I1N9_9BACT|nr:sulfatase [Membranihabitans marinus]MBY5959657.1 sulfatase [Membranihabitans marinus]